MEKKRSVGIWIYGIIFLTLALLSLIFAIYSFLGCILNPGEFHYGGSFLLLFSIILMIFFTIFLLLGIFTLLRKSRVLILILLIIPLLVSLYIMLSNIEKFSYVDIPQTFSELFGLIYLFGVVSGHFCFFISTIFFFTRPKVKEQFK